MQYGGYCEVLVKVQASKTDLLLQKVLWGITWVCLALSLLLFLLVEFFPLLWLLTLAGLIGAMAWNRKINVEYEYQYVDGSLRIDRIIAMKKRKKWGRFDLEQLQLMAPEGCQQLYPYRKQEGIQHLDCSSHNPQAPNRYQLVFPHQLVTLEPTEEMVRLMWLAAPTKVIRPKKSM